MTPSRLGEASEHRRGLRAPPWWTLLAASAALAIAVQVVSYVRGTQELFRTVAFVGIQLEGARVIFIPKAEATVVRRRKGGEEGQG